ncbi:MAG: RraA family protein [Corynebacterium sp.]|nr:RraA family protein [Corynebacterium sp.]
MLVSATDTNLLFGSMDWERVSPQILEKLKKYPTAIISDVLGRMTSLDSRIKRIAGNSLLVGTVFPITVAEGDNLAVHKALDLAEPNDVFVINAKGQTSRAILGDLVGDMMLKVGIEGAVIDGAVRDKDELEKQGLQIFGTGLTAAGPWKNGPGELGMPAACGGIVANPGDVIVADNDGAVIIPQNRIAEVITGAEEVQAAEGAFRLRIQNDWKRSGRRTNAC